MDLQKKLIFRLRRGSFPAFCDQKKISTYDRMILPEYNRPVIVFFVFLCYNIIAVVR